MSGYRIVLALAVIGLFACNTPKPEEAQPEIPVESGLENTSEYIRLDSLSQLLKSAPNDPKLLNERAKAFLDVNETNYALADVGRALMIDSTVAEYYLTISDVYFRLNKPQMCLNALKKANTLQPDYKEPLYRLAQFSLYIDKYQDCIDYANKMLRIDAQDDRPFMIKSLCFKQMGDTTKAIENLLEAVTENPDNFDAYMELGVIHLNRRDPLSIDYLKNALAIQPENTLVLYDLGLAYQNMDKLNDALRTYTEILAIDSTYSNAYYNIGFINYQFIHDYNEALKNFDKAVKMNPKYYQAVYMRGLCFEAKGDVARAKSEYAYALELSPNYKNAADGLTRILSKGPK